MPTFKFSKLVRDKIVEQQIARGITPNYYKLDIETHKKELLKKLLEEIQELGNAAASEIAEEIADTQQALDDLRELYGISKSTALTAQRNKDEQKGAFKRGCTSTVS